ncbi:MAG: efflux RND transporter permease subunit [Haliscomenobacter sp.]|nr:efflux RND transporter permease subunit [Haliscomenobacter sp.]
MLGVLPITMALGSAATSRIPMGVAIIGGLLFSLVLTLYVIPAIYPFFNRAVKKEDAQEEGPQTVLVEEGHESRN